MAGFMNIKEKVEELKKMVAGITPEMLLEYAKNWSQGGFHRYSFLNTFLCAVQLGRFPGALAPFSKWKELGYMVNKGTHGLAIWVPMIKDSWVENPTPLSAWNKMELDALIEKGKAKIEGGKVFKKSSILIGFSTGKVFDISQTNCTELPKEMQGGYMGKYHGAADMKLSDIIKISPVPVTFHAALDGANGNTNFEEIRLLNGDDTRAICTFFHELGHILCDHNKRTVSLSQKEAEAEAVSFICSAAVGIEHNGAAAYIQNWGGAEFDNYSVFTAVEKILNKLGKVTVSDNGAGA